MTLPLRLAALALVSAAAALATGCGSGSGSGDGGQSVSWQSDPVVVTQPELPDDKIVSGKLRNDSDDTLDLDVEDVRVVHSDGSAVRATVTFAAGYSHSLYPPRDAPKETPREEKVRLGRAVTIEPGKSAPFTVAWRTKPGEAQPVRVDLGQTSLALPRAK